MINDKGQGVDCQDISKVFSKFIGIENALLLDKWFFKESSICGVSM
jgi:hypothetical protein